MNEDQLAELHAVKAIATTYLREGINIVDAVHEAMRYARWATARNRPHPNELRSQR